MIPQRRSRTGKCVSFIVMSCVLRTIRCWRAASEMVWWFNTREFHRTFAWYIQTINVKSMLHAFLHKRKTQPPTPPPLPIWLEQIVICTEADESLLHARVARHAVQKGSENVRRRDRLSEIFSINKCFCAASWNRLVHRKQFKQFHNELILNIFYRNIEIDCDTMRYYRVLQSYEYEWTLMRYRRELSNHTSTSMGASCSRISGL